MDQNVMRELTEIPNRFGSSELVDYHHEQTHVPDWFTPIVLEEDLRRRSSKASGRITFHEKTTLKSLPTVIDVEANTMSELLYKMQMIYREKGYEWQQPRCYQAKLHSNCKFPLKPEFNEEINTIFLAKDQDEVSERYDTLKWKWNKYLDEINERENTPGNCAFDMQFTTVSSHSSYDTFNDISPNEKQSAQSLTGSRHHHHRHRNAAPTHPVPSTTEASKTAATGDTRMREICRSK